MRGFPNTFSEEQIEDAIRLMNEQNENPEPREDAVPDVNIWNFLGISYEEWVAKGMPVPPEYIDWVQEQEANRNAEPTE